MAEPPTTNQAPQIMSSHRYKVGELVHMRDRAGRALGAKDTFKVTATLPLEGRRCEYRIRSELEPYERVVTEDCLVR